MKQVEVNQIIVPVISSDGAGVKLRRSIGVNPEYLDPFLAGSYLVTAIKHEWTFTDYRMRMEIVKNGLMYSMGDAEDEVNLYED